MELVPNRCTECWTHVSLSWYGVVLGSVHISQLLHRSLFRKSDIWHGKVQFYTFVTVN